jgi:hypothetical protein
MLLWRATSWRLDACYDTSAGRQRRRIKGPRLAAPAPAQPEGEQNRTNLITGQPT